MKQQGEFRHKVKFFICIFRGKLNGIFAMSSVGVSLKLARFLGPLVLKRQTSLDRML